MFKGNIKKISLVLLLAVVGQVQAMLRQVGRIATAGAFVVAANEGRKKMSHKDYVRVRDNCPGVGGSNEGSWENGQYAQLANESELMKYLHFTDADLPGADFEGSYLYNSFIGANLRGANFRNTRLSNYDFSASFENADLRDADFTGAYLGYVGDTVYEEEFIKNVEKALQYPDLDLRVYNLSELSKRENSWYHFFFGNQRELESARAHLHLTYGRRAQFANACVAGAQFTGALKKLVDYDIQCNGALDTLAKCKAAGFNVSDEDLAKEVEASK